MSQTSPSPSSKTRTLIRQSSSTLLAPSSNSISRQQASPLGRHSSSTIASGSNASSPTLPALKTLRHTPSLTGVFGRQAQEWALSSLFPPPLTKCHSMASLKPAETLADPEHEIPSKRASPQHTPSHLSPKLEPISPTRRAPLGRRMENGTERTDIDHDITRSRDTATPTHGSPSNISSELSESPVRSQGEGSPPAIHFVHQTVRSKKRLTEPKSPRKATHVPVIEEGRYVCTWQIPFQPRQKSVSRVGRPEKLCQASFTRKADLERHMEFVHEGKGVECPSCGSTFARKDSMLRHQSGSYCTGLTAKRLKSESSH